MSAQFAVDYSLKHVSFKLCSAMHLYSLFYLVLYSMQPYQSSACRIAVINSIYAVDFALEYMQMRHTPKDAAFSNPYLG